MAGVSVYLCCHLYRPDLCLTSGHNKPLLAFFARIYELRPSAPFIITVLSSSPVMPKIERELRLLPRIVSDKLKWVISYQKWTAY
jgi:hypothetical protein